MENIWNIFLEDLFLEHRFDGVNINKFQAEAKFQPSGGTLTRGGGSEFRAKFQDYPFNRLPPYFFLGGVSLGGMLSRSC